MGNDQTVVCGGMLINGAFLNSCMLVGLRFCFFCV